MVPAKQFLLDKMFLLFLQRIAVIAMLAVVLVNDKNNTTGWAMAGAVIADLFHAAKNGGGSDNGKRH